MTLVCESQGGEVDGALEVELAKQDARRGDGRLGTCDVGRAQAEVGLLEHHDLVLTCCTCACVGRRGLGNRNVKHVSTLYAIQSQSAG